MSHDEQNQLCLLWGIIIALVANIAVISVTIWDIKTSTDNDLWVSGTYLSVLFGATLLAFLIALPLNVIASFFYWKNEVWPKAVLATAGCCLSLLPWIMPVITERVAFGW